MINGEGITYFQQVVLKTIGVSFDSDAKQFSLSLSFSFLVSGEAVGDSLGFGQRHQLRAESHEKTRGIRTRTDRPRSTAKGIIPSRSPSVVEKEEEGGGSHNIMQGLVEESAALIGAYPGENAENIVEQQGLLAEAWRQLQQDTMERRDNLNAAYELQRFQATVRNTHETQTTRTFVALLFIPLIFVMLLLSYGIRLHSL